MIFNWEVEFRPQPSPTCIIIHHPKIFEQRGGYFPFLFLFLFVVCFFSFQDFDLTPLCSLPPPSSFFLSFFSLSLSFCFFTHFKDSDSSSSPPSQTAGRSKMPLWFPNSTKPACMGFGTYTTGIFATFKQSVKPDRSFGRTQTPA